MTDDVSRNPFRFWTRYLGKPHWTIRAWGQGVSDGLLEPEELGSGMTYECTRLNTVYDQGVNLGQVIGIRRDTSVKMITELRQRLRTRWHEEFSHYSRSEKETNGTLQ